MNDRESLLRLRLRPRIGAAALLLFMLPAVSFTQTVKPVLKPLDVFDLQWVSDPQISPDGRSIAYVRMSFDIKTDRPRGVVWLIGVDGKHARPLSGAATSAAPYPARMEASPLAVYRIP